MNVGMEEREEEIDLLHGVDSSESGGGHNVMSWVINPDVTGA